MSDNPDRYRPSFSERYSFKERPQAPGPGETSEKARKQLWDNLFEAVEEEEVDCDDWGNPIFHVGAPSLCSMFLSPWCLLLQFT